MTWQRKTKRENNIEKENGEEILRDNMYILK